MVSSVPHILSANQFDLDFLDRLYAAADHVEQLRGLSLRDRRQARRQFRQILAGHALVSFFFTESTRTRISHELAAQTLGMSVVGTEDASKFSSCSANKQEPLHDAIRTFCEMLEYVGGIIVLRHKQEGSAAIAAAAAGRYDVSVINGGDGNGEHPTQALLDLFTIRHYLRGWPKNRRFLFGGDLKRGRTARSLCRLLLNFPGISFVFLAPKAFQMGQDIINEIAAAGLTWEKTEDMDYALKGSDVVYWTRIQRERPDAETAHIQSGEALYKLDQHALSVMEPGAKILHPLPRNDEIPVETDDDPRAVYFAQAGFGLPVRVALIAWVMGELDALTQVKF